MRPKARSKSAVALARERKQKRLDLTKETERLRRRIETLRRQQLLAQELEQDQQWFPFW